LGEGGNHERSGGIGRVKNEESYGHHTPRRDEEKGYSSPTRSSSKGRDQSARGGGGNEPHGGTIKRGGNGKHSVHVIVRRWGGESKKETKKGPNTTHPTGQGNIPKWGTWPKYGEQAGGGLKSKWVPSEEKTNG